MVEMMTYQHHRSETVRAKCNARKEEKEEAVAVHNIQWG
jgi:hypothetical protein